MAGIGVLDWIICAIYMAVVVGLGIRFSREQSTNDDFFLGGSLYEAKSYEAKSIQCRKAFPNQNFCSCLANKLPMVLTIPQYTINVTSSLDELRYDELTGDERKMIDIAREVREECAQHLEEPYGEGPYHFVK